MADIRRVTYGEESAATERGRREARLGQRKEGEIRDGVCVCAFAGCER